MGDVELWRGILWLHLLAMAFFVGGQLVVGLAVVPVARRSAEPEWLRPVARRFGWGSLAALVVLLATGVAMASHYELWESETLRLKLGLVVAVVALTVAHLRRPRAHVLQGLILLGSLAIVWLGLALP